MACPLLWCYAVNQSDTNYVCHMTTRDCKWKTLRGAHPSALSNGAHSRRRMNEVSIDRLTQLIHHTLPQKLIRLVYVFNVQFRDSSDLYSLLCQQLCMQCYHRPPPQKNPSLPTHLVLRWFSIIWAAESLSEWHCGSAVFNVTSVADIDNLHFKEFYKHFHFVGTFVITVNCWSTLFQIMAHVL